MTAEIPRVRVQWEADEEYAAGSPAGVNGDSGRRFADETMELPIFRELESAWFRTRSTSPTSDLDEINGGAGRSDEVQAERYPTRPVESVRATATVDSVPDAPSESPTQPVEEVVSVRAGVGNGWRTAADEGWQAASALEQEQDFTVTTTGLPKRVPMSQLVPGGVEKVAASAQRRSPEAVRGLLSAYHRGVQRGRTNRSTDPMTPEHTTAGPPGSQAGKEQEA
jgi:hypothetical protein